MCPYTLNITTIITKNTFEDLIDKKYTNKDKFIIIMVSNRELTVLIAIIKHPEL